jgi:enediyne biosynthesis protein E4
MKSRPATAVAPIPWHDPDAQPSPIRRCVRPLAAGLLIGIAYWLARIPAPLAPDPGRFRFEPTPLVPDSPARVSRTVHPDYRPLAGWISSVGAAASLGDLENTGHPDGCILVDPRANSVSYLRLSTDGKAGPLRYQLVTHLIAPPFTSAVGLDAEGQTWAPMGSVIGDFDGDGWLDVLVYYWGRLPVVFRNPHGNAVWTAEPLWSAEVGGDSRWYSNCVCQADIDGDGKPDLVIGNYFPSTAAVLDARAAIETQQMQSSMSRAVNGGRKYILLNHGTPGHFRFTSAKIELEDDETDPADRAHAILDSWTLAIAAGDLDGDFLPELYFANDFGPDRFLHNECKDGSVRFRVVRGQRRFGVPKSKTLGRDSFKGMGVDFAVMDPQHVDEAPTILVSNISESWALLESHFAFQPIVHSVAKFGEALGRGIAPYRDQSESLGLSRSGWGWDIKAADFANEGQPEIVQALGFLQGSVNKWAYLQEVATGNDYHLRRPWAWPFFRTADSGVATEDEAQSTTAGHGAKLSGDSHLAFFARAEKDQAFVDIGDQLGFEPRTVSRGIAIGDVDHDGRVDFVLANQWQDSIAYRNVAPRAGSYLGVRVLRPAGAKPAAPGVYPADEFYAGGKTGSPVIGARVVVATADDRVLASGSVDGGNGHSGRRAAEIHFGLGSISPDQELQLHVQWRQPIRITPRPAGAPPWIQDGWMTKQLTVHAGSPGAGATDGNGWWVVVVGDQ